MQGDAGGGRARSVGPLCLSRCCTRVPREGVAFQLPAPPWQASRSQETQPAAPSSRGGAGCSPRAGRTRGCTVTPVPGSGECCPAPAPAPALGWLRWGCPARQAWPQCCVLPVRSYLPLVFPWCGCPRTAPALCGFHKQVLPLAQPLQTSDGLCSLSHSEQGSNSINETLEF